VKYVPKQYQYDGIEFLLKRAYAGLFMAPGRGKTSIILALLTLLFVERVTRGVLIIAPLRVVYGVWPKEVKKWDEFKHLSVGLLHGDAKDTVLRQKHHIYVMNPEGLHWLITQLAKWEGDFPFDILVIDESNKFKDTSTQRYSLLKPLLKAFRRRYILTGTPAPNGLQDLFGQMFVMDQGQTFSPYITHFRRTFYQKAGYGVKDWILKHGAEERIHKMIAPRVMVVNEKDDITLPPLTFNNIWVALPEKARAIYKQLEYLLRVEFEKGTVTAANAAVKSMKCRQAASGALYLDKQLGAQWIHTVKFEALLDLVEEMQGRPALLMYQFEFELEKMWQMFGRNIPVLGHGTSGRKGDEAVDAWNRGDLPLLFAQPKSMSHGLNMQEVAGSIVWVSPTWSFDEYTQTIQRVWRQGQKGAIMVHHLLAERTVDQMVMQALGVKEGTHDRLMGALENYWKEE
jgi:superfamily II DNA or RNA helicase